jgi:hypothetical protein
MFLCTVARTSIVYIRKVVLNSQYKYCRTAAEVPKEPKVETFALTTHMLCCSLAPERCCCLARDRT